MIFSEWGGGGLVHVMLPPTVAKGQSCKSMEDGSGLISKEISSRNTVGQEWDRLGLSVSSLATGQMYPAVTITVSDEMMHHFLVVF